MNRRFLLVIGLTVLLSSFIVGTAFADVSLLSENVSYSTYHLVSNSAPHFSFVVAVTLDCEMTYDCSVAGGLPPSATCHLNVTPNSATLSLDYHIGRVVGQDIDGNVQVPLSPEELSGLLGHSPPIEIPVDSLGGTITVIFHGKLFAENFAVVPQGYANPTSLEWLTWTPQDTVVSSIDSPVTLKMDTVYAVWVTVTVWIVDLLDEMGRDSSLKEFPGTPSLQFAIPEFSSTLIVSLFMMTTVLVVVIYRTRHPREVIT